jgi:hypothetical protein
VILPPAAAALALSGALGVAAFERDLRGYHFGWRQGVAILGALAVGVAVLPVAAGAIDGRWQLATSDHAGTLRFASDEPAPGGSRVLWVGDPAVLPTASFDLDLDPDPGDGGGRGGDAGADTGPLGWALTGTGLGSLTDRWALPDGEAETRLGRAVTEAVDGRTDRLGALLGTFGVRWVVLVSRAAPSFEPAVDRPLPAVLTDAFERQLDLVAVDTEPSLRVMDNLAAGPVRRLLPAAAAGSNGDVDGPADTDVAAGTGVLDGDAGFDGWRGSVDAGTLRLAAVTGGGWQLRVDGERVDESDADSWAASWAVPSGEATLRHRTSPVRVAVVVGQALAWLALVVWLVRSRRGRR